MCDLMVTAFQTNVTRVATFMFGRESSQQRCAMIRISEGHHELSHHQADPDKIAKFRAINTLHVRQFAYLIGKLKSISEGDGTLLDSCMIAYGSGTADGNCHTHHNLPILVAGKGGGSLRTGRRLRFQIETPVNTTPLTSREGLRSVPGNTRNPADNAAAEAADAPP